MFPNRTNEALGMYLREVLVNAGYTVLVASHAVQALFMACGNHAFFDLLLTDVVMPQISGPELAARLRKQNPMLKTLSMSGVVDESAIPHSGSHEFPMYLQKPFSSQVLIQSVRQLTESKPA